MWYSWTSLITIIIVVQIYDALHNYNFIYINKLIITICIKALTLTMDQYKLEFVQHNVKIFCIIVKYWLKVFNFILEMKMIKLFNYTEGVLK